MTQYDLLALALFAFLWLGFNWLTDTSRTFARVSLTRLMIEERRRWLRNTLRRELRMIDTQILAGLQQGTAFFASSTIFALGGCFALLGATEKVQTIFADLPFIFHSSREGFEIKVGGLACLFGYAFFKFGWSYRLFNYCSILIGAIPMMSDVAGREKEAEHAVEKAATMNIIAAMNFNAGLRTVFLSIGYLGWFVNAFVFMATTTLIILVLLRRQFFSEARNALLSP
ncbi:DUF599 domain-containing protein [Rhizobium sp. SG2393]|uniref:DUF599 domain-containing protein n=1 Tax=Rhizobium sp. SG2393 TaxID=3276279 RepID=UPI0036700DFA